MKVPLLITQYLLQNKTLALQGLGSFTLESYYENPFENEKEGLRIPENSISFTANVKAREDDGLVAFISKQSGKIRPLASADLDSFLELGKQLLNIGKPFAIEGLGFIQKHPSNSDLEFIQGSIVIQKKEENSVKRNRKKDAGEDETLIYDENYVNPGRKTDGGRKLIFSILIVLGLGVIGWVGYFFYNQTRQADEPVKQEEIAPVSPKPAPDSSQNITDTALSAQQNIGSVTPAQQQVTNVGFNVVLEISSRNRAFKRLAKLRELGLNVVMTTTDSVKFKLAIPINAPLSDTARHRDSLRRFFARKVWIETN